MKFVTVLTFFAAVATASDIELIPKCARACITRTIREKTVCSENDFACACAPENLKRLKRKGRTCVVNACGFGVAKDEVLPAIKKICEAYYPVGGDGPPGLFE